MMCCPCPRLIPHPTAPWATGEVRPITTPTPPTTTTAMPTPAMTAAGVHHTRYTASSRCKSLLSDVVCSGPLYRSLCSALIGSQIPEWAKLLTFNHFGPPTPASPDTPRYTGCGQRLRTQRRSRHPCPPPQSAEMTKRTTMAAGRPLPEMKMDGRFRTPGKPVARISPLRSAAFASWLYAFRINEVVVLSERTQSRPSRVDSSTIMGPGRIGPGP